MWYRETSIVDEDAIFWARFMESRGCNAIVQPMTREAGVAFSHSWEYLF